MATRYKLDLVAKDAMGDYGYTIEPKPQGYTKKDLFMVEDTPLTYVGQQVTVEGKKYEVAAKTEKKNGKHLVDNKYDYTYTVVPVQGGGKQKRKKQTRKTRKGKKTRKGTRRV